MASYHPIIKNMPVFLYGGDYNPEQWMKDKSIVWPKDMAMVKKAGINTLTVGIFSWAMLEPRENEFHFEWLDEILDMMAENGIKAVLATPTAARPPWFAEKYPEVLRVTEDRRQQIYGTRHKQCLSSPVYREKVTQLNTLLAKRYANHPALGAWHINNEYGGCCHCKNCQNAFRRWLKDRYGTIENLNDQWWNTFWSHRYDSFDQIESPSSIGESSNPGLLLAWKRFVSWQYCDFYKLEIAPLKKYTPDITCTTNLMAGASTINYYDLGNIMDAVSWDCYPIWTGDKRDYDLVGIDMSFWHDAMRGMGNGKPFMLMESSPSAVNWHTINRLRQPGILELQGLQAIAHGSDSVQYFQIHAGRGGKEKYHGAVISHDQREDNRVYREVCRMGERLKKLSPVVGSSPENEIAVIFDWETRWMLDCEGFGRNDTKGYDKTVIDHYTAIVQEGYGIDVIDQTRPLEQYKIVCGPMTYMLRPGFADKVRHFVENGGTYITTFCSGWVNEEDLCYLGGFPGEIRDIVGVWNEETDAMDDTQHNHFTWHGKTYETKDFAAVIHSETAETLAVYSDRFYAGTPALTRNTYGNGTCYYIAARTGRDFLQDFYHGLTTELDMRPLIDDVPWGIICTERTSDNGRFLFVQNYTPDSKTVSVPAGTIVETSEYVCGSVELSPYGALVIRRG